MIPFLKLTLESAKRIALTAPLTGVRGFVRARKGATYLNLEDGSEWEYDGDKWEKKLGDELVEARPRMVK